MRVSQEARDLLRDAVDAVIAARVAVDDGSATDAEVSYLAARWAAMDDDAQARFFVEAARVMLGWDESGFKMEWQMMAVGRHLRDCECSTEDARRAVEAIATGLKRGTD